MLLPLLILASLAYMAYATSAIIRSRPALPPGGGGTPHPAVTFALAGGVPLAVTATMTYLFVIVGGATTVQFNAGSAARMAAWSTWVDLFPAFLFLTAGSGLGSLIWSGVCAGRKSLRSWIPVAVASFLLSLLAFFTVLSCFPSA